jgi:hypothetical protein
MYFFLTRSRIRISFPFTGTTTNLSGSSHPFSDADGDARVLRIVVLEGVRLAVVDREGELDPKADEMMDSVCVMFMVMLIHSESYAVPLPRSSRSGRSCGT